MIIKQIKLENFRQFKGEQVIEFSTDKNKNVSVILGSNTCGKTTIVGAFIWCLYDINNLKAPKSLLNSILASTLTQYSSQEVSVEVILTHDNKDYIIRRAQRFSRSAGDSVVGKPSEVHVSYKEKNGEMQSVNPADCKDVINSILPMELADYFFFDGERIKNINTKGNVVSAVRGLMGLDVYSSGMDHLSPTRANSVIGKLQKELDLGKDTEANRKQSEISQLKNQLEEFENATPKIETEINHWLDKKEELAKLIKDNKDVANAQTQKEKIEREITYLENLINTSEDRLKKDFNYNACKFFAQPLIKKAIAVINSAKEDGVGIPNMHSSSIDFIISRGKCICGCDLSKNQGAIDNIRHEQSLLPPQHIGTSIREFKRDLENAVATSSMYSDNISNDYKTWLDSQSQIERKQKELKEISEKIQGCKDVRKYEIDYQEACRQLERYNTSKQGNHDSILQLKTRIEVNEKEIARMSVTNDKNKKIMRYIDYTNAVYEWFKEYYDSQEKEVKDELLKSINENFKKMYHGSRVITMDDNYKITAILTDEGTDLAKSEGLETVTNFSFIMGLVELARERANKSDDEEQKVTEPYPIVMDAPFSNTDITHIQNITARLPEVAEQVIMFVMDKDWNYAKTKLEDKLGSKYSIEKVENKDNFSILRREI